MLALGFNKTFIKSSNRPTTTPSSLLHVMQTMILVVSLMIRRGLRLSLFEKAIRGLRASIGYFRLVRVVRTGVIVA
jgi:hypothetical protein